MWEKDGAHAGHHPIPLQAQVWWTYWINWILSIHHAHIYITGLGIKIGVLLAESENTL